MSLVNGFQLQSEKHPYEIHEDLIISKSLTIGLLHLRTSDCEFEMDDTGQRSLHFECDGPRIHDTPT